MLDCACPCAVHLTGRVYEGRWGPGVIVRFEPPKKTQHLAIDIGSLVLIVNNEGVGPAAVFFVGARVTSLNQSFLVQVLSVECILRWPTRQGGCWPSIKQESRPGTPDRRTALFLSVLRLFLLQVPRPQLMPLLCHVVQWLAYGH